MKQSDYLELQRAVEQERQEQLYRQQLQSPNYLNQLNRGYQQAQTRIVSIERETDNTYVNIVMDHPEPAYFPGRGNPLGPDYFLTNDDPVPADYGVTKTEPILDNCSEYYCSLVRFTIPLDNVPLLICPIIPNQINPLLTPLIIGIQYGNPAVPGTYFSRNVIYQSFNNFVAPVQNQPTQVITPFYYMYSYQNLIDMINTALASAYVASGLSALFPGYLPPYFEFNPVTNLFSLIVPSFFTSLTLPALFIPKIFINTALASFLTSFPLREANPSFQQFGAEFYINLPASNATQYYPPGVTIPATTVPPALPTTSYYHKYTQEYVVVEYWTSLRKIVIATNTIPVRNEYVPATNNLANSVKVNDVANIINSNQSGVNVSYPILTDFVPNISLSGESRSIAYYVPSGQYRLIDLISTNPLQKIDIQLFWEDRDGNLYPLLISLFQRVDIKLAFLRKSLYKNPSLLESV